jgi:hypothetical protein
MEHFIPFSKNDLSEILASKLPSGGGKEDFSRFCAIIGAVYHYRFYTTLEEFKASYLPIDPDRNIGLLRKYTGEITGTLEQKALADIDVILKAGNYTKVSAERLQEAFSRASPRGIDLKVNTDIYDLLNLYSRGEHPDRMEKKFLFLKKKYDFSVYDRVILVFKMKETFVQDESGDSRQFEKGKLYLKLFKNVPTVDLEMLFPDTKVVIRKIDQAKVIVPLAAGSITTAYKIAGYILTEGNPVNLWSQIGFWVLIGSLFGVALKAFLGYKNTVEKYLKALTTSLYFQNLDNNSGVFKNLVDDAEEEECKELILAYYFLLTWKAEPLTMEKLDSRVEEFFLKELGSPVDFEVEDAIRKLGDLGLFADEKKLVVFPVGDALIKLTDMWKALP